ncbi:MAG: hypothetical protein KME14_04320 [Tildeniella torsiva UHER 1998/13D]|jgi:hypothetical protein|nr:hypothetical protein [Tildeniella torsiva UHER 1998/13D]
MGQKINWDANDLIPQRLYDLADGGLNSIRYDMAIEIVKNDYGITQEEFMNVYNHLTQEGILENDTSVEFGFTDLGLRKIKETRGL